MILIVGCGFLGTYILKHISETSEAPVIATVRNMDNVIPLSGVQYVKCDVTNNNDIMKLAEICKGKPLTVFYLAAYHNIDSVLSNPSESRRTNIDALQNFLASMPGINKLFFASTDCVYGDSEFEKFDEASSPTPLNEYGKQKLAAENLILKSGFTVLRFPFMLDESLTSEPHFYDNICRKLRENKAVEMIDGMKRSVLSYHQAAELVYKLSLLPKEKLPAIINVCGDNIYSKYDIGCIVAKKLGVSTDLVRKISEEEGKKFFVDKRASCTSMDNTLLKSLLELEKIELKV